MDENKITLNDYVEKKLSAEIAELKVQLAKTEFTFLALQEENERLKAQLAEKEGNPKRMNNILNPTYNILHGNPM